MHEKDPYNTDCYCPIDDSKMRWVEDDHLRHFNHCDICGFEYWWLCTEEQKFGEIQKYLKKLPDEKIIEIRKAVRRERKNLLTETEMREKSNEAYIQLKKQNQFKRRDINENLRLLKKGRQGILENIRNRR